MIRSSVSSTADFGEMRRKVVQSARAAVKVGAEVGAAAARSKASTRVKSGRMAAIRTETVRETSKGVAASFISPSGVAWYQEYGTLGKRRRKLLHAPSGIRARGPGSGVSPLGFLYTGTIAGGRAMIARAGKL
jgi:hypothetical protein